ncbi:MAG: rhodanese-like domain-containing protein [Leptolyngbyaceae bacterium]|nr:rhodanese-like domain-containing protein [Leptolyngbyaceae bacterium]
MQSDEKVTATTDQSVVDEVGNHLGDLGSVTPNSNGDSSVSETIQDVKNTVTEPIPGTPETESQVAVDPIVVKDRLEKGEPALTIIDIRDRTQFNAERITGAVSMPMSQLVQKAESSLAKVRDIYLYGESDTATAEAAKKLRAAGFSNVAEIKGNLSAWKALGAPVEGAAA